MAGRLLAQRRVNVCELTLSISAHVLQKQITEGHRAHAERDGALDEAPHARFVFGIRARVGQIHLEQRQVGVARLSAQQLAAHCVHRDAIVNLVDGRD